MACADAIHNNAAVLIDMARRAPSEYIRTHVEGGGNGFELDDLLSRYKGEIYREIARRIIDIHRRYRTPEYPIGTSNPACYAELLLLADELESDGH